MPDLVHRICTRVATKAMDEPAMDALVRLSRENHQRDRSTGVLLHVGRSFFQVLEGPPQEIDTLYDNIVMHPRHTRITRIIYEPIARRFYGDTSMSLTSLTPAERLGGLGGNDQGRTDLLLSELDEGRATRLLRAFSQGRWRDRLDQNSTERQPVA